MAAITLTGPWPLGDQKYPYSGVYVRAVPRLAVGLGVTASRLLNPGTSSSAASSTTVPVAPVFTRFPATP